MKNLSLYKEISPLSTKSQITLDLVLAVEDNPKVETELVVGDSEDAYNVGDDNSGKMLSEELLSLLIGVVDVEVEDFNKVEDFDEVDVFLYDLILRIALDSFDEVPLFDGDIERDIAEDRSLLFKGTVIVGGVEYRLFRLRFRRLLVLLELLVLLLGLLLLVPLLFFSLDVWSLLPVSNTCTNK